MKEECGSNTLILNKSDYKVHRAITYIIIAVLCIPGELRHGTLGRQLGLINYLAISILIYILITSTNYFKKEVIVFVYMTIIYYIVSTFFYENKLTNVILSITSYMIPLLLIGVRIKEESFENIFRKFLKILNVIIILITFLGLIDFVFRTNVNIYISKFMTARLQELILNQQFKDKHRMYSFMGHPLFNTQLYLMFFSLNSIYSKYYRPILSKQLIIIISLIGVGMAASKTGFILIVLSITLINFKKSKIKHLIVVSVAFSTTLYLGIFDNTIQRFLGGSLTTGRSEAWETVTNMGMFPIKFFTGYGNGFTFVYNQYISWASAAFEYPVRMFSLEMGILMCILIYACIGVIPSMILLKRRHFFLFISYIIVFTDINTYNGLALLGDNMLIFCIFIFVILNMSDILYERRQVN